MTDFEITYDYLCPFARNGNEHVIAGLRAGADWDVSFVPFSLAQVHVDDEDTDIWDRSDANDEAGILALQAGLAVRELEPERFLDAHLALFAARHDDGEDIRDREVVADALAAAGVDADAVLAHVDEGAVLDELRLEHERMRKQYEVFGVPTFVAGGRGVFMRLLERADADDPDASIELVDRLLDLVVGLPVLHEFKQADLPV